MPYVDVEELAGSQANLSSVRNICILAHVDHGKTTLADSLVASNGIISKRLAGKLRYMDSRADEQERGITMKSSSISLYYRSSLTAPEYLINLIDSPGHVDFSSEVSTAIRLCDGAIIVVDVVEGVCPQTRACLQQTYSEQLKPVLLLNKIDRLILEKKMEPLDAYIHLTQVLEQINAVMGSIFASDVLANEDTSEKDNYTSALEDSDDSKLYFAPEAGNVVFCSAIDGWGFSLQDFAVMYSDRFEIDRTELEKVLWGNFYYNAKKKCFVEGAQEKAKKPMFVQLILENIWNLYDMIAVRFDKEKIPAIEKNLGIKLAERDLRVRDSKSLLKVIFDQWLPIDKAVLKMVVNKIPPPNLIADERAEKLLCPSNCDFSSFPEKTRALKEDFKKCDPKSDVVIAFVSKMISVHISCLPGKKAKRLTEEEIQERRNKARERILEKKKLAEEFESAKLKECAGKMENLSMCSNGESGQTIKPATAAAIESEEPSNQEENEEIDQKFIAFARIFSGTLKKGMKLYVLSPKHDPRNENLLDMDSPHISEAIVTDLYLFMGSALESLNEVPAGNIVGIGGIENYIIKTGTLSSTVYCPSFSELSLMATPILKVAIEPKNPLDMPKLVKGLKLLNQADACVQVSIQESGEHVITTLGEVHLEKCITDLEEKYAKVELSVSKPIVSFRETIVPEATVDMVNEAIVKAVSDKDMTKKRIVTVQTANKLSTIKILALPLPQCAVDLLEKYQDILKAISGITKINKFPEKQMILLNQFKNSLAKSFEEFDYHDMLKKNITINEIWSVGPRKCGTNILLNLCDYKHPNFWDVVQFQMEKSVGEIVDVRRDYTSSFVNGFQLATLAGPLCEEPMQGVCFAILEWNIEADKDLNSNVFGPFSGQVMSSVKEGCRKAFQNQPQRLVSPMYSCNIVVNADVLGKMYAVIGRRHGKILSGDLTQGSGNFSVTAILPVIESFNFAQEMRKQTSGLACPQLVFSHWEIIDIDPFWVPSTEEEYMHFGEKADSANRAKMYMDSVRKRKGLFVEEKTVEYAEKQRTLSKNK